MTQAQRIALAASGEMIVGLGQFRVGCGGNVTEWHDTAEEAWIAYCVLVHGENAMNKILKAKRYDSISYQILDGEQVVALAIKQTDGQWRAYDLDEKKVKGQGYYPSPSAVARAMSITA